MLPGPRHYQADVAHLTGEKERSKSLMLLRVKPTPTRFPTNSLYTPMDNTPLHSISSVCVGGTRLVVKEGNGHQLTANNAKPPIHKTCYFTAH